MSATQRDFGSERTWTIRAGESRRVSVAQLVAFAEDRAGAGPVRDLETRDFGLEVREELADARNYLVWQLLQEFQSVELDDEVIELITRALESVVEAFDYAVRARLRKASV